MFRLNFLWLVWLKGLDIGKIFTLFIVDGGSVLFKMQRLQLIKEIGPDGRVHIVQSGETVLAEVKESRLYDPLAGPGPGGRYIRKVLRFLAFYPIAHLPPSL